MLAKFPEFGYGPGVLQCGKSNPTGFDNAGAGAAAGRGITLITKTLRKAFPRWRKTASGPATKLVTSGSGGVWPGVDLDDTSALLDLMEGIEDRKPQ